MKYSQDNGRKEKMLIRRMFYMFVFAVAVQAASDWAPAAESKSVGSITAVTGTVELQREGHRSVAHTSSLVLLDDEFVTRRSSAVTIKLVSGSELHVGPLSSIRIDRDVVNETGGHSILIRLLSGKLHSLVPVLINGGDFSVLTRNAISGVRGTEFETSYVEGKPCPGFPNCLRYTDVGVFKGVVEVRSASNPHAAPVRVTAGYETTVPCEIPPSSPSPLGASELELPGYH
jgi:FecR protein